MIQLTRKSDKGVVGLEIEAGSIAATELRGHGEVAGTAIAPISPAAFQDGEVVDPDTVAEALRTLFSEHKLSKKVRLGIANQRVVVRTLRLPAIDDPKELEAAVRFQAQEQIPMPLDQAVLDYRVVGGAPPGEDSVAKVDVVVVAARQDMIRASLGPLRDAGLKPVGVDLSVFGLIRALGGSRPPAQSSEGGEPTPSAILYCNIGDTANLAVAKGRSCLFTRVAPTGLEDIAANLSSSTDLTIEHARMWLQHVGLTAPPEEIAGEPEVVLAARKALEMGVSAIQDELRLSLDFYGSQEGSLPVERIVLSGPGSIIPGLSEGIEAGIGLPFEVGRPQALSGLDPTSAARLTLSYGLALEN